MIIQNRGQVYDELSIMYEKRLPKKAINFNLKTGGGSACYFISEHFPLLLCNFKTLQYFNHISFFTRSKGSSGASAMNAYGVG